MFGGAHRLDTLGRRDKRNVIARAGQLNEAQVAVNNRRFGGHRNSRQAEPCRQFAFMHHTGALQILIHCVLHNQRVKCSGISQRAPHGQRIHHGAVAIGKGNGPGFAQQAELGHAMPVAAFGQSGHRVNAHNRRVAGAARDEVNQSRIVNHRIGVRHGNHGGHATGSSGLRAGGQCFAMLFARLAGEDLHVDKAGQNRHALAVMGFYAAWRFRLFADGEDFAILDNQIAGLVEAIGRVNQAGIGESAIHSASPVLFGRLAARASSTAIRTATPISTWSRMRLRSGSSATALSISTPRFIGPGCITSASGLA